jgi:hypothetical protein
MPSCAPEAPPSRLPPAPTYRPSWPTCLAGGLPAPPRPASIAIAVLRYRLYDIDRLINRTLVYALLTAILGLCYVAGSLVFVLVAGAGTDPPSWLVAAVTLAAAAIFRPARRRIQTAVDRRFNRRKYNTAKTIDAYSTPSARRDRSGHALDRAAGSC